MQRPPVPPPLHSNVAPEVFLNSYCAASAGLIAGLRPCQVPDEMHLSTQCRRWIAAKRSTCERKHVAARATRAMQPALQYIYICGEESTRRAIPSTALPAPGPSFAPPAAARAAPRAPHAAAAVPARLAIAALGATTEAAAAAAAAHAAGGGSGARLGLRCRALPCGRRGGRRLWRAAPRGALVAVVSNGRWRGRSTPAWH